MRQKRVVIAMSGGVDSSVAAAILNEQGYEVSGITMNLFSLPEKYCRSENLRSCCGWKATEDSHRVAVSLGISFYVADFRKNFEKKVITDFCKEYTRGRTPNPCIRCNQYIKFDFLMQKLKVFKADYLATGHHARVEYETDSKRYILKKGKDKKKDQSYFLYPLTQDQLSRTLMPIGYLTKDEVRNKAEKLGLPVAQRPESQEICFIPDKNYAKFLQSRSHEASKPGPIVNLKNEVLGQHKGIIHYTVGQRRGMGITSKHPMYVLAVQSKKNTIVAGTKNQLYEKILLASQVNWVSIEKIKKPQVVKAKIRYKHKEAKALITPFDSDKVIVEFENSQRAITPGQSVVFYDGDVVVGGGIIDKAGRQN
ncbi:MAG: tRNA 2-thiouridine(34) synthase MnmA [Candidatus Aminicenantes bacterium]|nr:tRNA 2-thiouridine(34) synthase MnmA [Candidatus Aminicenantes bacterium]